MKLSRILFALFLLSATAQAQMYKCVDARGVTHYSDQPRPECKSVKVDIRSQPPISGKLNSYGSSLPDAERDFRVRQSQRDKDQQAQEKEAAALKASCERYKQDLERHRGARRPSVIDEKGERRFLEASEFDARIAHLEAEIARTCR